MNYLIFLVFCVTHSIVIMFISILTSYKNFMGMLVTINSLSLCSLVFIVITGIEVRQGSFLLVLVVMGSLNFAVSRYYGIADKDSALNSVVALCYMAHFLFRVCLAVEGKRLDVSTKDSVYLSLINFMDIPFYTVGIADYVVPLSRWCSLNQEIEMPDTDEVEANASNKKGKKLRDQTKKAK